MQWSNLTVSFSAKQQPAPVNQTGIPESNVTARLMQRKSMSTYYFKHYTGIYSPNIFVFLNRSTIVIHDYFAVEYGNDMTENNNMHFMRLTLLLEWTTLKKMHTPKYWL
jgi:hypothetical protein